MKFSLRFLLLLFVVLGTSLGMHVQVESTVRTFKTTFSNNKSYFHELTGPADLQWISKTNFNNNSDWLDYLLFRRKVIVNYDASFCDENGNVTVYHCETEFLITQSETARISHSQDWYMSWT